MYLILTFTHELELGTAETVLPQEISKWNMKAVSLTIQKLMANVEVFPCQIERQTNRQSIDTGA